MERYGPMVRTEGTDGWAGRNIVGRTDEPAVGRTEGRMGYKNKGLARKPTNGWGRRMNE